MSAITWIDTTTSTNSYLAAVASEHAHGDVIVADTQTDGRGQRGNSWEAAPGLNLTFSMLIIPQGIEAAAQFRISQAVALGVAQVLGRLLPSTSITVKWPNDIYAGDRKICGILIENSVSGRLITRSIAGIGINVNQLKFLSDAPNPVSMRQIAGIEFAREPLLAEVRAEILALLSLSARELDSLYFSRLWRRNGVHPFIDHTCGDRLFFASITSIAPTGHITLSEPSGTSRTFAFKEVGFLIEQ
ncbi:MAG: biotin--[acetyl-CoA-carboxylase] ligase [Duncaniella sp.]|nr:biotin--[acetyl-CoA-carboxylase] ligase [Duncaniella sp.]